MDALGLLIIAGFLLYLASNQDALANIFTPSPNMAPDQMPPLPPPAAAAPGGAPPPSPSAIEKVALAIANAEGFNVPNSVAVRNNNPGNIGGPSATFPTVADGWNQLYTQIGMIFSNTSGIYTSSMSISEVGIKYANGDPNWAINVAAYLGVPTSTTFDQLAAML